jgi:hypothetical protein
MFVRLRFPVGNSVNYIVLSEFQFSRNTQYDVFDLSRLFGQKTQLLMLMGSMVSCSLSGTLYIKRTATNDYFLDGLYNSSFVNITFASLPFLIQYLNAITDGWNNGKNNIKTSSFTIEYVDNYNQSPAPYVEHFLPESFTFSITNKEVFTVNINLSGRIGNAV